MSTKFVKNAVGRLVPTEVNGKSQVPYMGVGKYKPTGRKYAPLIASCADYPADGNKIVPSLKDALIKSGLRDGMTISTHHHFRHLQHHSSVIVLLQNIWRMELFII